MNITSATFVKGLVEHDDILEDGRPQIAFIGRSNVGKSSLINSLTHSKNLAKTSSFPGRTQEINVFSVSAKGGLAPGGNNYYFIDLPGYGFAKTDKKTQEKLQQLIYWYLLDSPYEQHKVVVILDSVVGPTDNDIKMLNSLEDAGKNIVVVANKVDKLKQSEYKMRLQAIKEVAAEHKVIPYSSEKKIGVNELINEIFN